MPLYEYTEMSSILPLIYEHDDNYGFTTLAVECFVMQLYYGNSWYTGYVYQFY